MAKETAAEKAARIKREKRQASRAARHATKRAAEAASMEVEAPPVAPTKLGVTAQQMPGRVPKTMMQAREQLTQAFEDMGGVPELVRWGKKNPTEFFRIWARLIPKDIPAPETALPLETLLSKLAERADMSIDEAARQIGAETLNEAERQVGLEDAVAAFKGSVH